MTGKPLSEVTKEDAHDLHKKEVREWTDDIDQVSASFASPLLGGSF